MLFTATRGMTTVDTAITAAGTMTTGPVTVAIMLGLTQPMGMGIADVIWRDMGTGIADLIWRDMGTGIADLIGDGNDG